MKIQQYQLDELLKISNGDTAEHEMLMEVKRIHESTLALLHANQKAPVALNNQAKRSIPEPRSKNSETPTGIPGMYRHLIHDDEPFYTLPTKLLDLLVKWLGKSNLDQEMLNCEYTCSERMGDHSSLAGYWRGIPINCQIETMPSFIETALFEHGDSVARAQYRAGKIEQFLNEQLTGKLAYAGWLMINPRYLQERHDFTTKYTQEIVHFGLSTSSFQEKELERQQLKSFRKALRKSKIPIVSATAKCKQLSKEKASSYLKALMAFLDRWQLESLAAPGLPVPFQDHLGTAILPGRVAAVTRNISLSNTQAHKSTLELAQSLAHGQGVDDKSDHLLPWLKIVGQKNTAKNAIPRFARIFKQQHYWKAFCSRHALRRATPKLIEAFAEYFHVSAESVRKDQMLIARIK